MSKKIVTITKNNMGSEVAQGITLVDFWADWCGPCKMVAPILDELYSARDDFKLAKCDIDAEPELAEGFGIQGIPTVIMFKDGKAEYAAVGVKPREFYKEMLDAAKTSDSSSSGKSDGSSSKDEAKADKEDGK